MEEVNRRPPEEVEAETKNNLGSDNGGLAYSITTTPDGVPFLVWDSVLVTMTADEALSASTDGAQAERNEAARVNLLEGIDFAALDTDDDGVIGIEEV